MARRRLQNGRKFCALTGLLRNSTIFRCAKNWDSDNPRRKLPVSAQNLSSDLIVLHPPPPHLTSLWFDPGHYW